MPGQPGQAQLWCANMRKFKLKLKIWSARDHGAETDGNPEPTCSDTNVTVTTNMIVSGLYV